MMHEGLKDVAIHTLPIAGKSQATAADIIPAVLDSEPMHGLRFVLDRQDLQVDPQPIVCKDLSDSLVRLMFPVTGGPVVDGAVVSVVCLFDRQLDRTLYAHPMHAGPGLNPSSPRCQRDRSLP